MQIVLDLSWFYIFKMLGAEMIHSMEPTQPQILIHKTIISNIVISLCINAYKRVHDTYHYCLFIH